MSEKPYDPNDAVLSIQLHERLLECGVLGFLNDEALAKMKAGAVLLIRHFDDHSEMGWALDKQPPK